MPGTTICGRERARADEWLPFGSWVDHGHTVRVVDQYEGRIFDDLAEADKFATAIVYPALTDFSRTGAKIGNRGLARKVAKAPRFRAVDR